MWKWLRSRLRASVLTLFERSLKTEEAKDIMASSLQGLLKSPPRDLAPSDLVASFYDAELSGSQPVSRKEQGEGCIFLTARFRSGSTLLWNVLRHVEGMWAYYEPFNRRPWLEPDRAKERDPSHLHVSGGYWDEYQGLEDLRQHYREDWTRYRLYMDASAWDEDMLTYLRSLIARAQGRPFLQFNRLDFRLPWVKHWFPFARIVHLCRHPRDQWLSTLSNEF